MSGGGGGGNSFDNLGYMQDQQDREEARRQADIDREERTSTASADRDYNTSQLEFQQNVYNTDRADKLAQEQRDRDSQAAELARQAQAKSDSANAWTNSRGAALERARGGFNNAFQSRGVDITPYQGWVNNLLQTQYDTVQPGSDPTTSFNDDWIASNISGLQSGQRSQYQQAAKNNFYTGYDADVFKDTADDGIIDSILNTQRGNATASLDRAKARGQLNTSGYNSAITTLGNQFKTGRETAQKLGQGVIDDYRGQLRSYGDRATADAGNWTLGNKYDVNDYITPFNSAKDDLTGRFSDAVTGALSGQEFFDIGDVLNSGFQSQGGINQQPAFLDAQAERDRLRNAPRGAGGTGTF